MLGYEVAGEDGQGREGVHVWMLACLRPSLGGKQHWLFFFPIKGGDWREEENIWVRGRKTH